jgi:hypothetical protein
MKRELTEKEKAGLIYEAVKIELVSPAGDKTLIIMESYDGDTIDPDDEATIIAVEEFLGSAKEFIEKMDEQYKIQLQRQIKSYLLIKALNNTW